jgi:hypothetical protein
VSLLVCVVCLCVLCGWQDDVTGATQYRASSPDEEALVVAAKALGFDFKTPAPTVSVNVTLKGRLAIESLQYNILCTNEFNSSRCVAKCVGAWMRGEVCGGLDAGAVPVFALAPPPHPTPPPVLCGSLCLAAVLLLEGFTLPASSSSVRPVC